jgi:AAA+ superfamily predicted ATPase
MSEIRFAHLPKTRTEHFSLYFHAAVLDILDHVTCLFDAPEIAFQQFHFLANYQDQLALCGLQGKLIEEGKQWWQEAIQEWEETVPEHLPLRALRQATGLDYEALTLLVTIGVVEEDSRFGTLFDSLQGSTGQHRPTMGLLYNWQDASRLHLRKLQQLGLIHILNPEAPRFDQSVVIPAPIWDALRGEQYESIAPWAHYRPPEQLPLIESMILSETARNNLQTLTDLITANEIQIVIVRGPNHNGRHAFFAALARALERGLLDVDLSGQNINTWQLMAPLSTLLHTLPVVTFDLAPGETVKLAETHGSDTPLGIVLSNAGSIQGTMLERSIAITLDPPDPELRQQLWQRAFADQRVNDLDDMAERLRLTSGNIYRVAKLAHTQALAAGRETVEIRDVQRACRSINGQTLESLATYLEVTGDWSRLAVSEETQQDLIDLEMRCRKREQLLTATGVSLRPQVNTGVRALFSGPSGTGKTLAACLLASQLQMDIYRLDLSAVVNKYIGETEKNLNQIFSRAEELDVILLIDEGDALLTQRTSVNTSNDRYANLETNFLLQRLEVFSGVVIVTTNSSEHIDSAFQRRMDVTIDFRPPESMERWQIWQLHLPETNSVDPRFMSEVITRCSLTGGQIRNAALHATLLAINNGGIVTNQYLETAVKREYRKLGAVCPLRTLAWE